MSDGWIVNKVFKFSDLRHARMGRAEKTLAWSGFVGKEGDGLASDLLLNYCKRALTNP